jgi:hypothetical protein
MNFKYVILSGVIFVSSDFAADDFTLPKNSTNLDIKASRRSVVSVKKSREGIFEELGEILKNLLDHDRMSLELRAFFQDELELSLCGDELALAESSSKSQLRENLKLLQEVNECLMGQTKKIKELIIKIKKLKTGKLKG